MATNLLWFVMAGFLLGFATSTLWEWFYFRKERLKLTDRRIRELEAKLRGAEADTDSTSSTEPDTNSQIPTVAGVTRERPRTSAWGDTSYRSPGVFLESEELEADEPRDDLFGPERPAAATKTTAPANSAPPVVPPVVPPLVPTVDSISPKASTSSSTSPATSSSPPSQFAPQPKSSPGKSPEKFTEKSTENPTGNSTEETEDDRAFHGDAARFEQPTPADALRAKRGTGARSRQEVLAALRRNSEAVQRGEFPSSESQPATSAPLSTRADTLVSPTDPAENALQEEELNEPEIASQPATPALSPARQRWVNNPELTARTKEYPDDLSKIRGIGDVYKQRLYRAGIYTWKQIVEADTETLRRATSAYPSSNVEEWLTQAEKLMEKHGRKQAVYSGPPPDDMTKILGIGPVGASVLYRAGICTYEQLATTPKADLEALFPIAVAGDMPDFAQWIERAKLLADAKHNDQ